ncbi:MULTISPECIES: class I SAM-dependent methyltransferase [unclassified Blastococcus]
MDDVEVFWAVHRDLPREGVGSDATTRALLRLAGVLPGRRALDVGCGPGAASLVLTAEGLDVVALDTHGPFLERLRAAAAGRRVAPVRASMTALPVADGAADLVWCEGAAYVMGVDEALAAWRRVLVPGGVLVLTDAGWTDVPASPAVREFWSGYPGMRPAGATAAAAEAAGYAVLAVRELPESDWWDGYYGPMAARLAELAGRGVDPAALAPHRAEIALRRDHPAEYAYWAFVLRRR